MIVVKNTKEMQEYLERIKVSKTPYRRLDEIYSEYEIVGDEIHINLVAQQLWYRQNADPQLGITMKNSKEFAIIHNKIFGI